MATSRSDEVLLCKINVVIRPLGCVATDIGPNSVAVVGDTRHYGPSILVSFRPGMTIEEERVISTKITNEFREISRVLKNIQLDSS